LHSRQGKKFVAPIGDDHRSARRKDAADLAQRRLGVGDEVQDAPRDRKFEGTIGERQGLGPCSRKPDFGWNLCLGAGQYLGREVDTGECCVRKAPPQGAEHRARATADVEYPVAGFQVDLREGAAGCGVDVTRPAAVVVLGEAHILRDYRIRMARHAQHPRPPQRRAETQ
jgi:hypothetical protein